MLEQKRRFEETSVSEKKCAGSNQDWSHKIQADFGFNIPAVSQDLLEDVEVIYHQLTVWATLGQTLKKIYSQDDPALFQKALHPQDGRPEPRWLKKAARVGNLRLVQWLIESQKLKPTGSTLEEAARSGNLKLVQWLIKNQKLKPTGSTLEEAARSGNLESVQWLIENQNLEPSPKTLNEAVESGNLQLVKWLHNHPQCNQGFYVGTLQKAVWSGNVEVVQLMIEKLSPTIRMLDYAAMSGNLEIVKQLVTKAPGALFLKSQELADSENGNPTVEVDVVAIVIQRLNKAAKAQAFVQWLYSHESPIKWDSISFYVGKAIKDTHNKELINWFDRVTGAGRFSHRQKLASLALNTVLLVVFSLLVEHIGRVVINSWAKYLFFPLALLASIASAIYAFHQAKCVGFKDTFLNHKAVAEVLIAAAIAVAISLRFLSGAGGVSLAVGIAPLLFVGALSLKALQCFYGMLVELIQISGSNVSNKNRHRVNFLEQAISFIAIGLIVVAMASALGVAGMAHLTYLGIIGGAIGVSYAVMASAYNIYRNWCRPAEEGGTLTDSLGQGIPPLSQGNFSPAPAALALRYKNNPMVFQQEAPSLAPPPIVVAAQVPTDSSPTTLSYGCF